jgi:Ca2+-binding RTX toxin-like protein
MDRVLGRAGKDELWGDKGNDTLKGGRHNDILIGGPGRDILKGGRGADSFVLKSVTDSSVGKSDLIVDFEHGRDNVDLSSIDANSTVDGDQRFDYIAMNPFTGMAGELRRDSSGMLMGDVDGDGKADFALNILPRVNLTSLDFIL